MVWGTQNNRLCQRCGKFICMPSSSSFVLWNAKSLYGLDTQHVMTWNPADNTWGWTKKRRAEKIWDDNIKEGIGCSISTLMQVAEDRVLADSDYWVFHCDIPRPKTGVTAEIYHINKLTNWPNSLSRDLPYSMLRSTTFTNWHIHNKVVNLLINIP